MNPYLFANSVSFQYPQNNRGLKPFSLAIQTGEGVFIHGSSGCGKSTLARCISGLIPHLYHGEFQGEVLLDGVSTREMNLWQLSEQVGMVFQNPAMQILAETVEEEILFGLENLGLKHSTMSSLLEQTLDRFDLQSFRLRSPQTLSGGEQQKLALAAMAARNPQLMVLDEPLSMLDTTSALEFVAFVNELLMQGKAALICEHRHHFLQDIQNLRRLHLNNGLHETVPPTELASRFPACNSSFELQVNQLSVKRGGKSILKNLNFAFSSGQIVAIVGRNGAGKTTLLRAIMDLLPFEGSIGVEEKRVVHRPQFNMIFQNPDSQLFNAITRQEILYRVKAADPDVYEWLIDALDLRRYEQTPPLLLSEGEKRRVALATALMHPVHHGILLDEPSLGQDAVHKAILLRVLKSLANLGYLVIVSTHDLELAAQADQIMLLSTEGIVNIGESQTVIAQESSWRQIGMVKPDWMDLSCRV